MFLITVKAFMPYERAYTYRQTACDYNVAIARAVRLFKKEQAIKGKKHLDKIWVEAERLGKEL